MRQAYAFCLSLVLSLVLSGQTPNDPESEVTQFVTSGLYEGHTQKLIGSMGDAAAVLVTKIFSQKNLSRSDIQKVLVILNSAFADPRFVSNVPDRQPRTTLFVLKYLESLTDDGELKTEIVRTRKYVQDQYASSTKDASKKQ